MEERKFICSGCRKEIEFFRIVRFPGRAIYDPILGMRYDDGNNFCRACYKDYTGQESAMN